MFVVVVETNVVLQVYSGLYVNEADDLDDEEFEDLDQPLVVWFGSFYFLFFYIYCIIHMVWCPCLKYWFLFNTCTKGGLGWIDPPLIRKFWLQINSSFLKYPG